MSEYDNFIDSIDNDPIFRASQAVLCQEDFLSYLLTVFYIINGSKFKLKPFHKKVIAKLQNIADSKNKKRNLGLCLPVGSGKSLIIEYFITWCFARSVNNTFCYTSNSDRLINKLSKECKDIIESPYWQLLFNHKLKKDDRQRINFSFEGAKNRTGLTAGTTGGAITGLDAGNPNIQGFSGALIIDDPLDAGNARYQKSRDEVITFYDEKLATRRRTPTTPTILVMQRLHLDDLVGWIEKNEPDEWDIVKVQALNNDNTSFWEERYPVEELKHIQRINNFKFQSQYQQEPIASGGSVIKIEWFKYYPLNVSYEYQKIFITGDTAQKVKEHNDYSVFGVWGVTKFGKLHLLDLIRGKWEAPELKQQVKILWNRWVKGIGKTACSGLYIEDKASGTGLIQELQRECAIPIIPLQADKDKLTRLEGVLSHIEAGNLELPYNQDYDLNRPLLNECEAFTRDDSHKHDDIVDVIVYAIMIGLSKLKVSILEVL